MKPNNVPVLPERLGLIPENHLILQCGAAARFIAERYVQCWRAYFENVAAGEVDEAAREQLGVALVDAVEAFRNLGATLERAAAQGCDTKHDAKDPGAHEASPTST